MFKLIFESFGSLLTTNLVSDLKFSNGDEFSRTSNLVKAPNLEKMFLLIYFVSMYMSSFFCSFKTCIFCGKVKGWWNLKWFQIRDKWYKISFFFTKWEIKGHMSEWDPYHILLAFHAKNQSTTKSILDLRLQF